MYAPPCSLAGGRSIEDSFLGVNVKTGYLRRYDDANEIAVLSSYPAIKNHAAEPNARHKYPVKHHHHPASFLAQKKPGTESISKEVRLDIRQRSGTR